MTNLQCVFNGKKVFNLIHLIIHILIYSLFLGILFSKKYFKFSTKNASKPSFEIVFKCS